MKTSSKVLMILSGILMIVTGIISLCNPSIILVSMAWIIGILTLISGIMTLTYYFYGAKGNIGAGGVLFFGITDVILGIMFLGNSILVASVLPFVFAMWITFSGIEKFIHSFDLKKLGFQSWWLVMILGIACTVLGISTIIEPVVGAVTIGILVGTGFILHGITYLAMVIGINKIEKDLHL